MTTPQAGPTTTELADTAAREQARALLRRAVGHAGDPGALGDLAVWWAGVRGACPPPRPARIRLLVVSQARGDDGDTDDVDDLGLAGATALSAAGASAVRLTTSPVATGGDPVGGDPVGGDPVGDAERSGAAAADHEADDGTDLLVVSGPDDDASAALACTVVAALLALEPAGVVGVRPRDGRLDDSGWMATVSAVRDGLRVVRRDAPDLHPWEVVRALRGVPLAALAGVITQAARRRTPVVVDGTAACAAALVAVREDPAVAEWLLAACRPAEVAARLALDAVDLPPVVDLATRLGPGVASLAVVPMLHLAVDLLGSAGPSPGPA